MIRASLIAIVLALTAACASSKNYVGQWRFDTEDGSWVQMVFDKNGTGRITTWHAANACGMDNDFYWEPSGGSIAIREIVDDAHHVTLHYTVKIVKGPDGQPMLDAEIYERNLVKTNAKGGDLACVAPGADPFRTRDPEVGSRRSVTPTHAVVDEA